LNFQLLVSKFRAQVFGLVTYAELSPI
jgi:hypothetical protein